MHQESITMLRDELAQARYQQVQSQFPPGQSLQTPNTIPPEINPMQPFMPSSSLPLTNSSVPPHQME